MLGVWVFSVVFLSLCGHCLADGCYVPPVTVTGKMPEMPIQRSIVKYLDGKETLIVEAAVHGEGKKLAWILPVPSIPERFEKVSPGFLKTLSLNTGPEIIHKETSSIVPYLICLLIIFVVGISYFFGGKKAAIKTLLLALILFISYGILKGHFGAFKSPGAVHALSRTKVISTQVIGSYQVFVIESGKSSVLNSWLADNGFMKFADQSLALIDDYIDKKWFFVAARLKRKTNGISMPHPLMIQFKCDHPVYPMRLTSLAGSDLYLELFVIAENEATPGNYSLKKEYCNVFERKEGSYIYNLSANSRQDEVTRTSFLGTHVLGSTTFLRNKRKNSHFLHNVIPDTDHRIFDRDSIGHPYAEKFMWDRCVITKLTGKISSTEMSEDLVFRFDKTTPFRATMHTKKSALLRATVHLTILLMICLPILAFLFRDYGLPYKKNTSPAVTRFFYCSLAVCFIVFSISYLFVFEKIDAEVIKRNVSYDFQDIILTLPDTLPAINTKLKHDAQDANDAEIMKWVTSKDLKNPFTTKPVIIEDSPGNFSPVRDSNGSLDGFNLYWLDGTPFFIPIDR